MNKELTGRFAPTPSGHLHLGNLLCAMVSWLSVRSKGGRFLLRVEDIDIPRCPRSTAEENIADLRRFGFDWDEEPLIQSERGEYYEELLSKLQRLGVLYPCFCTRAELHATQAPNLGDTQYVYPGTCYGLSPEQAAEKRLKRSPALRVHVPDECISFQDRLYGEQHENLARDCGDFVLRRSDGLYGYQLAVVADDAFSRVTEVIRGRDILSATPRQIYLQRLLGFPTPEYLHIPLLTDVNGRRLAKRDHDLSLSTLCRRFAPEEILGMLAYSAGLQSTTKPHSLYELASIYDERKLLRNDMRLPSLILE